MTKVLKKRKKLDKDIKAMPNRGGKSPMRQMRQVPIDSLKPYPGNARRGDVEGIMESLQVNGQFRPIVVQKDTRYVLAGNHTLQAALRLGWKDIAIVDVDVDETEAKRIVVADNRLNDTAGYDEEAYAELLRSLPDAAGTGFTQEVLDDLDSWIEDINAGYEGDGGETPKELVGRSAFDESTQTFDDVDDVDELSTIMPGVSSLKPDAVFDTQDPYGIPELIPEMLFDEVPEDISVDTWSGPTSSEDDGESFYVYSYGTDSTKGMPWDRSIIGFYTSDSRAENWWADPAKYTARMVNAGVAACIGHDFSLFAGLPMVCQLWNVYRNRWLSRYMQEAGIKIIPNLQFSDLRSLDFSLAGIPVGVPVAAIQAQTIDQAKTDKRQRRIYEQGVIEAVSMVQPKQLMVYGAKPGFEIIEELELPTQLILVENRSVRRSKWQKERDAAVYRDAKSRKKSARVTGISQDGVAMRGVM